MIRPTRYDGVEPRYKLDVRSPETGRQSQVHKFNAKFIGMEGRLDVFGRRMSETADIATRRYEWTLVCSPAIGRVGEADNVRHSMLDGGNVETKNKWPAR